jgi:hypothetical protein
MKTLSKLEINLLKLEYLSKFTYRGMVVFDRKEALTKKYPTSCEMQR